MGEISITKLLVVAALVVLLFGTKKLRTLGGDLGAAIKGFKKALNSSRYGLAKISLWNMLNRSWGSVPDRLTACRKGKK